MALGRDAGRRASDIAGPKRKNMWFMVLLVLGGLIGHGTEMDDGRYNQTLLRCRGPRS